MREDDSTIVVEQMAQELIACSEKWSRRLGLISDWLGSFGPPGSGESWSETFSFGSTTDHPRTLDLVDKLQVGIPSAGAQSVLTADAVIFDPVALEPGETSFRILVDADHAQKVEAGVYRGKVAASADPVNPGSSPGDDTCSLWLVIP